MEMYRSLWLKLAALLLLAASLCGVLSSTAFAESTVEVLPAPEVESRTPVVHGDGSITITSNCINRSYEENTAVTISSSGEVLSTIPREEDGWETYACFNEMAAGFDNTIYVVQRSSTDGSYGYPFRIAAIRNGHKLWTQSIDDPVGCGHRSASIRSMALGQDGNLYVAAHWSYWSESCPEKEALASISPSTGALRFMHELPNIGNPYLKTYSFNEVMPYKGGAAIINQDEIFYFNYEGEEESGKTFTAASGEEGIGNMRMVPETGRIYWNTGIYKPENKSEHFLFYKDPGSSSKEEINLPEKQLPMNLFVTPFNGVVVLWEECVQCVTKGFDYINEEGSLVYEKLLSTESGGSVVETFFTHHMLVDDFGNVIVLRTIDESSGDHDRNVVVDSFSPAGIKTRLFNSSSIGTKGVVDSFTTWTSMDYGPMGKGHVYVVICHEEGKLTENECTSSMNPEVVSISDTTIGEYDYPRSAIFKAGLEKSSYVALGDSYSSGEGVPSFISPSDEDGCHRSHNAYPAVLAEDVPSLRLDAFVACSGAKTNDVEEGMDEEPSQIDALGPETEIVTITIGGNDIGFGEFAKECVISTCDSSSPAYEYSMEQIATDLPEKLEQTYRLIHEYAENAEVYVVGYPQVVSETEPECGVIFAKSEEQASREVVTALDKVIKEEVEAAGGKFIYVNPDAEGSPFIGHELCVEGTEPYFNGFYFPETKYSFHPNERGQQAYAELIAEVL